MPATKTKTVTAVCTVCRQRFEYTSTGGGPRRTCSPACKRARKAETQSLSKARKESEPDEYPVGFSPPLPGDELKEERAKWDDAYLRSLDGRNTGADPRKILEPESVEEYDEEAERLDNIGRPFELADGGHGRVFDDYRDVDRDPWRLLRSEDAVQASAEMAILRVPVQGARTGSTSHRDLPVIGSMRPYGWDRAQTDG